MKKFIFFIIFIALLGGAYWFIEKNKSNTSRCDEGFRFNPATKTCEIVTEQTNGEINFSTLKIKTVSGNEISLLQEQNSELYNGKYEVGMGSTNVEYISLDPKQITSVDETYAILPYIYTSGGTGQFLYVGLFNKKTNAHLDGIVLGDRISIDSTLVSGDKIKVNFKDRLLTESFAETPTIPTQFVFEIKNEKIIPILQLQNADYGDIEIKSPVQGEEIIGEVINIKGAIPGNWYFEGNATFKMLDTNTYKEVAFGNIQALSDWMTTQKVPFEISVSKQSLNYTGDITVIISSDNPEGDEKKTKRIYLPIRVK